MLHKTFGLIFSAFTLSMVMVNCTSSPAKDKGNNKSSTDSSVETKTPNSDYKPAFAGQTRVPAVVTKTPISITLLDSSLQHPWGICQLPDGRFLISQKMGNMRIETTDGRLDKIVEGFPKVNADGQGGLLDVNIDPDFVKNRMIYWDYSEPITDSTKLLAIAKGTLSKDETKIENPTVIYRAMPAYKGNLQYGSRILFDKQGNLLVSTGERSGKEIRVQAQWLNSSLGKIIHITKDGKAVPDGPFANTANARPEIYAYGFRSPEGMAWNPQTGDLWEVEFGPRGGDEVNIIKPGKNYGWPIITYGIEYSGEKVGDGIQQKQGMEQPIYYWDPSVSPSGIAFYNSDSIAEWKGDLFLGCLSGSHIDRLVIKDNKVVGEEWLMQNMGQRFRALIQGKDGALYAVTDEGHLYKIAKK
ncbi:PQQ-dependent sugar dehydrogenase [Arachidicoccus sp.]|uniref:PQQ-dependent sugar dehydrogenase n=1 Tax=Arachidicoccus sp. TaxID=1872624 RepID=UPI003D21F594